MLHEHAYMHDVLRFKKDNLSYKSKFKSVFQKRKSINYQQNFFYINVIFVDAKTFRFFWHVPIL